MYLSLAKVVHPPLLVADDLAVLQLDDTIARRSAGTFQEASRFNSLPATHMRPALGRSSLISRRMKVDLPEPDWPTTKTNSPLPISTETSSRAMTSLPYTFVTWSSLITLRATFRSGAPHGWGVGWSPRGHRPRRDIIKPGGGAPIRGGENAGRAGPGTRSAGVRPLRRSDAGCQSPEGAGQRRQDQDGEAKGGECLAGDLDRGVAVDKADVRLGRHHHHQPGREQPRPLGPLGVPVREVGDFHDVRLAD